MKYNKNTQKICEGLKKGLTMDEAYKEAGFIKFDPKDWDFKKKPKEVLNETRQEKHNNSRVLHFNF